MSGTEHVVILRVRKDCEDSKWMTDTQLEQWILEHFQGCDYGAVSVDSIKLEPCD